MLHRATLRLCSAAQRSAPPHRPGLPRTAGLSGLTQLDVRGSLLTDCGLLHLRDLALLQQLNVSSCGQITTQVSRPEGQ